MEVLNRQIYRFEDVEVDASRRCLRRGGVELEVRQKSLRALLFLLENRHRLVVKEELIEHVWEGLAVTDDALVQLIKELRRHLGDDPRRPRFIKTVPRGGYRFIGAVEEIFPALPAAVEVEQHAAVEIEFEEEIACETAGEIETQAKPVPLLSSATSTRRRRQILAAAVVITLLMTVAVTAYVISRSRPRADELADVRLPHAAGKRTLAVMFFENQSGDAEMNWLREGLADMLITNLSRSSKLNVLGRDHLHLLLERIGHDPQSNLRLDEALEIARRAQAETVALGSFARLDGKVRVGVQLYDTRTGSMMAAESIFADQPSQILTQIDLLSLKLAARLGIAPAEENPQTGIASVMTDNLEAYRFYSLAVEKAQGFQNTEALTLLEKAIALDPQFAMAHARIGYTYAVTWAFAEKAKPYLEKAFQLSDRLTDKDRLYIAGWYSIANLDFPGAIKAFEGLVKKYPLEIEAYVTLTRLLEGEGRLDEAIEVAKQAVAFDDGAKDLYNTLGKIYAELWRYDDALAMFRRYVELAPEEPNAHDSLALGYQWAGRYPEAMQEYERALALNPNFEIAIVHLGNAYLQQGRYRDAMAQYNRYIENAPSVMDRARGYQSIARVQLKKGDLQEAERATKEALRYNNLLVDASFYLSLERGELGKAAKLLERNLTQWPFTERGARRNMRTLIYWRGLLHLKGGNVAEAVEDFKEVLRQRPSIWEIDFFEDCLANANLELGRFDEAIQEYERIRRLNPNYPLLNYHLARAYEGKGELGQARGEYEKFLQVWAEADPDVPEVRVARAKLNQ